MLRIEIRLEDQIEQKIIILLQTEILDHKVLAQEDLQELKIVDLKDKAMLHLDQLTHHHLQIMEETVVVQVVVAVAEAVVQHVVEAEDNYF